MGQLDVEDGEVATLKNGVKMPMLGFGTFRIPDGEEVEHSVMSALKIGYRSIDTASYYRNETGVGKAIADSGLKRDELFITTKVWVSEQGYEGTLSALDKSLSRLGTGYVDLYLVHWPRRGLVKDTWKAMEKIYMEGKARAIGVSNFLARHLEELYSSLDVEPAVNQIEFHPQLYQGALLEKCKEFGIQTEAWSPLMQGNFKDIGLLKTLAAKYGKTEAQILLRWDIQHEVVTIPKSTHRDRMAENAMIFDFEIDNGDMELLDSLDEGRRYGPNPDVMYE
ncbi:MAG TPA: aldo/keto reductase [Candidatus Methanofastidiosa archaeon]|nr:aldo/keto reductase [Candidatus Methanofastidiosa archaeon]HPR42159.1 aldo/keto reductase [Candidatus Methanofastidiosa archaeon]